MKMKKLNWMLQSGNMSYLNYWAWHFYSYLPRILLLIYTTTKKEHSSIFSSNNPPVTLICNSLDLGKPKPCIRIWISCLAMTMFLRYAVLLLMPQQKMLVELLQEMEWPLRYLVCMQISVACIGIFIHMCYIFFKCACAWCYSSFPFSPSPVCLKEKCLCNAFFPPVYLGHRWSCRGGCWQWQWQWWWWRWCPRHNWRHKNWGSSVYVGFIKFCLLS